MTNIVKGSLAAVAKAEGQSLAESFMNADAIIRARSFAKGGN